MHLANCINLKVKILELGEYTMSFVKVSYFIESKDIRIVTKGKSLEHNS